MPGAPTTVRPKRTSRRLNWPSGRSDSAPAHREKDGSCFSGGGIRSATFGWACSRAGGAFLVSQRSLGTARLLAGVDYLSTVSGEDIWAAGSPHGRRATGRCCRRRPGTRGGPDAGWEPEPAPLRHLRRFSNYLNPQLGPFRPIPGRWSATRAPQYRFELVGDTASAGGGSGVAAGLLRHHRAVPVDSLRLPSLPAAALLVADVAYMSSTFGRGRCTLAAGAVRSLRIDAPVARRFGLSLYWAWLGDLQAEPGTCRFASPTASVSWPSAWPSVAVCSMEIPRVSLGVAWKGLTFAIVTGAVGGLVAFWMTWKFTDPASGDLYDDRLYTWLSVPAILVFSPWPRACCRHDQRHGGR